MGSLCVGEFARILIGVRTSCLHLSTLNNAKDGIVGRPASSGTPALSHRIPMLCCGAAHTSHIADEGHPETRNPRSVSLPHTFLESEKKGTGKQIEARRAQENPKSGLL